MLALIALAAATLSAAALAAPPDHLALAARLVNTLTPEHNVYGSSPTFVYWEGVDGHEASENQSKCSSFVSALFTEAYDEDLTEWMGCSSPVAQRYFDTISAEEGFEEISTIRDIEPGDIIAMSYGCPESTCSSLGGDCSSTGHVMVVAAAPVRLKTALAPVVEGTMQFVVRVIDSSSSYHGTLDTRYQSEADGNNDSGVGEGAMRLYLNLSDGSIAGYTWSTSSSSTFYDPETRPLVVGRYAR